MKIAIIDDGIDYRHPSSTRRATRCRPGFRRARSPHDRKGDRRQVVLPLSAAPLREPPHNPDASDHATHVAGIAAGNHGTQILLGGGRTTLSGVAPRAYLGNYRVLTVPTVSNVGLDGNSPEIAAAIEAAVQDGMDVINLSIGEPEIPPSRDLVVRAIDGASAAGVVSTISAGNDFEAFDAAWSRRPDLRRRRSRSARRPSADAGGLLPPRARRPCRFASPEVSAPGVDMPSAAPNRKGQWEQMSGTSMAAPHVAGDAAGPAPAPPGRGRRRRSSRRS